MKTKKLFAIILALVMILSCMTVTAFAGSKCEEITITLSGNSGSASGAIYTVTVTFNTVQAGQSTMNLYINGSLATAPAISSIEIYNGSALLITYNNVNAQQKSYVDRVSISSIPTSVIAKIYYQSADEYNLTSASSLQYDGGVDCKVNGVVVTKAESGSTVTATAIAVEGYEATLSSSDVTFTTNNKGVATFTMPEKAVTIKATYTPYAYLDLESSATYPDKQEIAQNYTFAQTGDTTYTDVTKVKIEWTLPEIAASYTSNKTWDPDTMTWEETKTTAAIGQKTATFKFTNYSSVAIGAQLSFKKEIVTDSNPYASNVLTLQSILNQETHEQLYVDAPSGTITHVYTPNASDFNSLEAGSGKYGTYTVSIVGAVKVTFDMNGHGEAVEQQYVGIGGKVAAPENPTADGYEFGGWYTDEDCTEGNEWNFETGTVSAAKTLYAKWTYK